MKHLIAAALVFAAAPAAAQTIESATGDWSDIPVMSQLSGRSIDTGAVAALSELVRRGQCTLPGQHGRDVDMNVPFLVLFNDNGSVDRLVVHSLGCPRAEGMVAWGLLRLIRAGGFTPPGHRRQGWFRGEVGFSFSNG